MFYVVTDRITDWFSIYCRVLPLNCYCYNVLKRGWSFTMKWKMMQRFNYQTLFRRNNQIWLSQSNWSCNCVKQKRGKKLCFEILAMGGTVEQLPNLTGNAKSVKWQKFTTKLNIIRKFVSDGQRPKSLPPINQGHQGIAWRRSSR